MRFSFSFIHAVAVLGLVAISAAPEGVEGKYFSDGWAPGMATTKSSAHPGALPTAHAVHSQSHSSHNNPPPSRDTVQVPFFQRPRPVRPSFNIKQILSDKVTSLTGGRINVTQALDTIHSQEQFSRVNDTQEGFVRLTDENWEEKVEREQFPEDGVATEEERVWLVLVHGPPRDPTSQVFWDAMNNASAVTQSEGDLQHVKFARMDFMTEAQTCARWLITRPPYLVVATNRGKDLRFLGSRSIQSDGEIFRRLLTEEIWKELPVWRSRWGPGGDRAWLVEIYIQIIDLWNRITTKFPSWVLLLVSGLATQSILQFMHRKDPSKTAEAEKAKAEADLAQTAQEIKAKSASIATTNGKTTAVETSNKSGASASSVGKRKGKDGKSAAQVIKEGDVEITVQTKKV